jgi:FtsH-binding integral membrane protein
MFVISVFRYTNDKIHLNEMPFLFQTIVEAYTIGVLVSFYDVAVVLQAFFLTAGVVVGLTVFAFQTTRDFTHWGTG